MNHLFQISIESYILCFIGSALVGTGYWRPHFGAAVAAASYGMKEGLGILRSLSVKSGAEKDLQPNTMV